VSDERSDAQLLHDHVTGDPGAFEELYQRHRQRLWAVALRTTGDPEDAADALQDALISVLRNAGTFRGEAAVTSWLHRIVVNASLDRIRRNRSKRLYPLPDDPEVSGNILVDATDHMSTKELQLTLEQALANLPDEQRIPIVLVDVEGYRVDEVASLLDIPVGTVKSRCARGRARLAKELNWLRKQSVGNPTDTPGRPIGTASAEEVDGT
jgi:RNA polymerase sigma-70 factor, ECF subfamily